MPERFRYCPYCTAPLAPAEHGGLRRLACTRCDFVRWENPVPVVAAIVEHEGRIVLARNALWPPGMFALVTGFMEKTDTNPASAVLREVEEELGLAGEIVSFVGHYRFTRMNQLIMAYHVRAGGCIRLDPELVEYRRHAPEQLRPWPGATGDALRDWMLARGLEPLPYDAEPLKLIRDYHRIGAGIAAGGRPQALQFRALSMANTQVVIALAPADDEERRLCEASGMRYQSLPLNRAAPADQDLDALREALEPLRGQHCYIHDEDGVAAGALALLYCVLECGVALEKARRGWTSIDALPPVWSTFIGRQLAAHGKSM